MGPVRCLDNTIQRILPYRQVLVALFILPALASLHQLIAQCVIRLVLVWMRFGLCWLAMLLGGGKVPGTLVAVHSEAALPWHPDQLGVGAGGDGGGQTVGTEQGTAHDTVDAGTLVFTAGAEILTVLVDPPVILTRTTFLSCPADALGQGHVIAVVALQSLVVVAGHRGAAVLVQLGGTHLAAPAAVGHRTHPGGAREGHGWTLTYRRAAGTHLTGDCHCQENKDDTFCHNY